MIVHYRFDRKGNVIRDTRRGVYHRPSSEGQGRWVYDKHRSPSSRLSRLRLNGARRGRELTLSS